MTTSTHPERVIAPRDPDELLTPAEVAAEFKIPISTLYQWNYKGRGPRAIKVGRHLRYRRRDCDAFLEAQQSA